MNLSWISNANKYWRARLSSWIEDELQGINRPPVTLAINRPFIYSNPKKYRNILTSEDNVHSIINTDCIYVSDIVSGFDILSQNRNFKFKSFNTSIEKIQNNKIYNASIFLEDLNPFLVKLNSQYLINQISDALLSVDEIDVDRFFDQLNFIDPESLFDYNDVYATYVELSELLYNRDQIEFHLKLKALGRLLRSEIQKIKEHEQLRVFSETPIIFNLREYLDLIYNIKNVLLLRWSNVKGSIIRNVNRYQDGSKIQNRFIMLAC